MDFLLHPPWSVWVLTPLLIFFARMTDVSLATLRIIMLSRGRRRLAPFLGFFEILIWLIAIRQIFQHLDNWLAFVAYAAGFASGTALGMAIEQRLAIGLVAVRVIATNEATQIVDELRSRDFGVTSFAAEGQRGQVKLIYTIIPRKKLNAALSVIRGHNPKAFVSITDIRSVSEGFFPAAPYRRPPIPFAGFLRKSK